MPTGQMSKALRRLCDSVRARCGPADTAMVAGDRQLLASFIACRDEAAFESLVRRHGPMVLAVCRRVTRNEQDAEDAFQATFLVLVRKASSLGSPELVGNWLYGVAYRTALKARTASARRRSQEMHVRNRPKSEAEDVSFDLQQVLDRELNRLPDKYRVPVVLCELEGRGRKEVARQLRIPEGTLSSRLATARKMLAKRLARHGLAIPGGIGTWALTQQSASAAVPTSLISSTVKAAVLIATGQVIAQGVISTQVAALTEGVLKAMFLTKLKVAVGVILVIGMVGLGTGVLAYPTLAAFSDGTNDNRQVAFQVKDDPKSKEAKEKKSSRPVVRVPKTDKERIQGTWAVVAAEFDGQDVTERVQAIKAVFKGDRVDFSYRFLPADVSITFQLDPAKDPKAIDFTLKSSSLSETMKGIYELKGDTLRFCVPIQRPKDQERPLELKTVPDSSLCLFVMKRQKEEAGKAPDELKSAPKRAEVKNAEAKESEKSERIIFWLKGELASIGPDGKGFARLPRGRMSRLDGFFRISPDGRQLAYPVYDKSYDPRIFVADLASEPSFIGRAARLAGADFQDGEFVGIRARRFCWSPDGANLAWNLLKDRKTWTVEHGIINVKTREQKELPMPQGHFVSDWSPDGQWFLTSKNELKESDDDYEEHHVYLVKRDGSTVRRLDEEKGRAHAARFSPDGKKVLFVGCEDHKRRNQFRPFRVYVADLPAGKARPVSPELNADIDAACWSPDGKRIAYPWIRLAADTKFEDEVEHILSVIDADGGNPVTLWTEKARMGDIINAYGLDWLPASAALIEGYYNPKPADAPKTAKKRPTKADGIVFLLNEELAIIQPDGKGYTRLPTKAKHIFGFHVSPDGKRLAYTTTNAATFKGRFHVFVADLFGQSSIIAGISRLAGNDLPEGDHLDGEVELAIWSADGTKLACCDPKARNHSIVDVKTGEKSPLSLPEGHWLHDWSPDGNWFLTEKRLEDTKDNLARVYLVKKDGSEVRCLNGSIQNAWFPRFSPDGRKVLFVSLRKASRVYALDLPDGKPRPVSPELNAVVYSACWSPDGKRLAYIWHQVPANSETDEPVEYVLSVIGADRKNPVTLRTEKGRLGPSVHVDWR